MSDLADLTEEFRSLESCCMHDPQWSPADVEKTLTWLNRSEMDYGETDQLVIVQLKSGFGLLTSWSDTTGHGCQCAASTVKADTLHELLHHLTADELIRVVVGDD